MFIHTNDPHSYYEPGQPRIQKIHWDIRFDFDRRRVLGAALYTFDQEGDTSLDTRDLEIVHVMNASGSAHLAFEHDASHPVLGTRLSFRVPGNRKVRIEYLTSPSASGIQWMAPELAGGHPFVYTQGEAINARSYIPCQDTPSVKFRFDAIVHVPEQLRGLVAASEHGGRIAIADGMAAEHWKLPYPIPSYLIAFAVGDLVSKDLSDRSRVWAQPGMIDQVAAEFEDIPRFVEAGEALFGPYPFGRYDVLVMPPAFPYGGMENPCLSFLTPALIAGDKSGVTTVIHELAHSWTGNLVTNANWSSFWLNEGWTVYAEYRIGEAVLGRNEAMLHLKLLEREFALDVARFIDGGTPEYTVLAIDAPGIDPDDVFSRIPYFKGAMFLMLLEEAVGRPRFDRFIREYLDAFTFASIPTEAFLAFASEKLGAEVLESVGAKDWVYGQGLPANAPAISSPSIEPVERLARTSQVPASGTVWSTPQLQLYLELLPRPVGKDFVQRIDTALGLRSVRNTEVRWSFLVLAVQAGYDVRAQVESFLCSHGRKKYLEPLYEALAATPEGRAFALEVFARARGGYHPVAVSKIESILKA